MPDIELSGVVKNYGKTTALNSISFRIMPGERYSLLGPNGAGKSTTLKLIAGLLEPDMGDVMVGGHRAGSNEAKALIGYLPEDAIPYGVLSVRENIEYMAALRGVSDPEARTEEMLEILSLKQMEKYKVQKLSRGNRQKTAIAMALIHKPRIAILDEPLNYLDIPTQEQVVDFLESLGATFLVSTHIMSIAEKLTDSAIIITHGNIVYSGPLDNIRKSTDETIERAVARMMEDEVHTE
ncbi:ABC transporter ATP-binding protein [Thermogymnomonas acidicola]|uniref:ABC transporter ATP-binding protein n=1 Tax=Thermogymnomonas acidicola TaxID=399579 RepID=UPI00166DF695|nr:ABC transporter ATP-binding protein [Thermogymnomonas acidicola]